MISLSMIIMNLTVAAVIEGLNEARKENTGIVGGSDIDQLIETWKFYDPKGRGMIPYQDFVFLLHELDPPLGMLDKVSVFALDQ